MYVYSIHNLENLLKLIQSGAPIRCPSCFMNGLDSTETNPHPCFWTTIHKLLIFLGKLTIFLWFSKVFRWFSHGLPEVIRDTTGAPGLRRSGRPPQPIHWPGAEWPERSWKSLVNMRKGGYDGDISIRIYHPYMMGYGRI